MTSEDEQDFGISIRHSDERGIYYLGKELAPFLGYTKWEAFLRIIHRARKQAIQASLHFQAQIDYVPTLNYNLAPILVDYRLTHYALFKILECADSYLPNVVYGREHFTIHPS